MASIVLPEGYGSLLLCIVIICIQCLLIGFSAGMARKKHFNKKFFEENFPELKGKLADGGYPDNGSGYYSNKLSHDAWVDFNNAQRAHYNYLEGLTLIVVLILVSGLQYTWLTLVCAITYIIGRVIYTIGYKAKGARGRIAGALTIDVVLVVLMITSIMTAFNLAGGVQGILGFLIGSK